MSGIFGIFCLDGRKVRRADLVAMSSAMAHRGPDGQGIWVRGGTGLGHRMLRTSPGARGDAQPWVDEGSGLVITADARIDNREGLSAQLGIRGAEARAMPDSRLILAAYAEWGEGCVGRLLGDFAFAIWDRRRRTLFCVRDHLGIRPFHYHISDDLFVFASEARAVAAVPGVPRRLNAGRVADFLVTQLEGIDKTSTFYQDVHRLPPAHVARVTSEAFLQTEYWTLDPAIETGLGSDREYVEAWRELLTRAVGARLRCDGEPACMLSGGMDSSSIVGVARGLVQEEGGGPLLVVSGISDEERDCRETRFIRAVLDAGGLHSVTMRPADLVRYAGRFAQVFERLQEPWDAAMTLIIGVYLLARDGGARVVLDGIDGDLVVSLSPSYPAWLLRQGRWLTALAELSGQSRNFYRGHFGFWRLLFGAGRSAFAPPFVRRLRRRMVRGGLDAALRDTIIDREFAEAVDLEARLATLRAHGLEDRDASLNEQHAASVLHPYLTVGIERYDRVAAICGVEPRHPLLDRRLVEFCVGLPWDQKVRGGWSKYIMRRAAEDTLPAEVCWRRGWEHVGWDFTLAWMRLNKESIIDEIEDGKSVIDGYVDARALAGACRKFGSGHDDQAADQVWEAYSLVKWLRSFG